MIFEKTLKGGHPNSLGNTLEVVDTVLGNTDKMEDLFLCYQSDDETVRLRTSNAFKKSSEKNWNYLNNGKNDLLRKLLKLINLLQNGLQFRFSMNFLINWMKKKKLNLLKSA